MVAGNVGMVVVYVVRKLGVFVIIIVFSIIFVVIIERFKNEGVMVKVAGEVSVDRGGGYRGYLVVG